jgi:hypothetical protein
MRGRTPIDKARQVLAKLHALTVQACIPADGCHVLSAVARLYPATVFDAIVRIAQTNKDIEIRDNLGRDLSKALTDLDSLYDKLEHKGERAVPMDKIDRLKNDRDEARTRYNEVCHVVALAHHGIILVG